MRSKPPAIRRRGGDALSGERNPNTAPRSFVGIMLEERDLVALFGDDYRRYKNRVSMLVPWRKSRRSA